MRAHFDGFLPHVRVTEGSAVATYFQTCRRKQELFLENFRYDSFHFSSENISKRVTAHAMGDGNDGVSCGVPASEREVLRDPDIQDLSKIR